MFLLLFYVVTGKWRETWNQPLINTSDRHDKTFFLRTKAWWCKHTEVYIRGRWFIPYVHRYMHLHFVINIYRFPSLNNFTCRLRSHHVLTLCPVDYIRKADHSITLYLQTCFSYKHYADSIPVFCMHMRSDRKHFLLPSSKDFNY